MSKIFKVSTAVTLVLLIGSSAFAASVTKQIKAKIDPISSLSVKVNKFEAGTNTWLPGDAPSIDFGTLTWDNTYKVWRATHYYAVDVAPVDNGGTNWRIQHTGAAIVSGANSISNSVNVTFKKAWLTNPQTSLTVTSEADLANGKVSFANSYGKAYTKNDLGVDRWLRIYYGIATGKTTADTTADPGLPDNPGVEPITASKPAGTYTGSITLTFTQ